jgi:hypothetical protein
LQTLALQASALVLLLSSPRCSMGDVSSRAGASEYGKASIDFLGMILVYICACNETASCPRSTSMLHRA